MKNIVAVILFSLTFNNVVIAEYSDDSMIKNNRSYQATITRDIWGVPHVYGKRDEDAAFGLAYAHADDDIKNIAENMYLYRAQMGLRGGFEGAVTDYLIKALKIHSLIDENYHSSLSKDVREVLEGYVAGLNYWNEININHKYKSLFPISVRDVLTGFVIQNLYFSGVVTEIEKLQDGRYQKKSEQDSLQTRFYDGYKNILGSNAIAVSSFKTDDESTRLIINSHQPLDGPVAWYEAHIKSDEGWNMMGGTFPGSPFIFVGFNENIGWGLTVNKPDLTDVYELEINATNKNHYLLDGKWIPFKESLIRLPVKIFGPIKWTFKRQFKESVHGPVFENDDGVFAVRFSGMRDIRQVEQWYRMNKSQNLDQWLSAMSLQSIVSFNAIYADKEQNILFFHNAVSPERDISLDWSLPVNGDDSSLIWNKFLPMESLPLILNPESGWLVSTNQDPFRVTSNKSNLSRENYSNTLGLQTRMTNRAYRAVEMFEGMRKISKNDLLKLKFDNRYSKQSRSYKYIEPLFSTQFRNTKLQKAQLILKQWDLATDYNNRGAALGVCVLSHEWLAEQEQRQPPEVVEVFKNCVKNINKHYKRIDPKWSEVNFLIRGDKKQAVQGGPDTMRAIYGETQKDSSLKAVAGDGLVIFVEWDKDNNLTTESIHQYGSATQNKSSAHFSDQVKLFAEEKFKPTYFDEESLKMNISSTIEIPFNEN